MHDNAPAHKPIAVEKMLHDFGVRLLDPYPAHSPDFNPIEHVWSWMTHYVNNEHPTHRRSLIDAIERAWNAIPQSVIQGYIDNLPARLAAVERAGGARLD
jgi:transposase